jgi:hypothetical protein
LRLQGLGRRPFTDSVVSQALAGLGYDSVRRTVIECWSHQWAFQHFLALFQRQLCFLFFDKAEARAERRLLLQSLLAKRFKLVVHHETRIEPGSALSVAKGGPKFEEASPSPPGQTPKPLIIMENGILTFNGLPIEQRAEVLSQLMGRAVADKTGKTGNYEFTIP